MSTQVSTGTQLGIVGVDEVIGEVGNAKKPKRGSIDARRPSPKRVVTRTFLNIAALIVFVMSVFPVYYMVNLSFTQNSKIISRNPSLFPFDFTLSNYNSAWNREAAPGQTDFAHALPTTHGGALVGTLRSDATVFSFYANKTITTGEGGMLVTRDAELAKRAKVMRRAADDAGIASTSEQTTGIAPRRINDASQGGAERNRVSDVGAMPASPADESRLPRRSFRWTQGTWSGWRARWPRVR